ncbi:MAG TPA: ABC transporter permease [Clostridiaceae bacterium]|nr:ABC transporter permease [Clostridiaceae bacterium]
MSKNKDLYILERMKRGSLDKVMTFLILIVEIIIFTSMRSTFLSYSNFHSILLTSVQVGLIAIGECICIIGGFIDLSVGMVASFAGLFAAVAIEQGAPLVVSILVGWLVGLFSGFIAGMAVSRLGMNAFITTYALQQIYRGLIFIWTQGMPRAMVGEIYKPYVRIGQEKVLGGNVQLPVIIMIVIYIIFALFMKYHRVGRSIYLVGHNHKSAYISGINVKNIRLFMFMASGFLAATAGMLVSMRTGSQQPFVGELYALEGIASALVGGTAMEGGKGSIGMTFFGVMIVYMLKNGLIMIGMPDFYQYIAIGILLFIAVLAQTKKEKK